MLAIESFPRHHIFAGSVSMDQGMPDPYTGMTFNGYDSYDTTANLPLSGSFSDSHTMHLGHSTAESQSFRPSYPDSSQAYLKASASRAEPPPPTLSTASGPSVPSATSSAVGSPYSTPAQNVPYLEMWSASHQGLGMDPTVVPNDPFGYDFGSGEFDSDVTNAMTNKTSEDFVDPSLIHPPRTSGMPHTPIYAGEQMFPQVSAAGFSPYSPIPSPAPSHHAIPVTAYSPAHFLSNQSPQITYTNYDQQAFARAPSIASDRSYQSHQSPLSASFETDEEGRQRCPNPDCGRIIKDLKAHMLTHQSERPEKCPIATCEYNQKGFARKYDKNRHTLTHYKGTMVCGFCPGSGSAAEKSFNRADVFKRHLTSVHGVEQTPPNSRKKTPSSNKKLSNYCQDATGKCSTCSMTFTNAQDFYEHLDDCVLRVVQQEEPSEAINQQHLTAISRDEAVADTLDRNIFTEPEPIKYEEVDEAEDDDEDDDDEDDYDNDDDDMTMNDRSKGPVRAQKPVAGRSRTVLGTNSVAKAGKGARKGLTRSQGGVPLVGKGRKKRRHYPTSWGMSPDKMKMKKRVLCVYDGPRRLWKDDMMLDNEFEVRVKLPDGKSYVTDLDVETLKRAEAIHGATEEEKGPWVPDPMYGLNDFMAS